jgi:hypothetical protein
MINNFIATNYTNKKSPEFKTFKIILHYENLTQSKSYRRI